MAIRVVEFSSGGYKIRKIFAYVKINIPKENYWILRIGLMGRCQNLSIILVIKWFKNWFYVRNKKCAPKLVFFNEKKNRKIRMIFDIENWLWKSNFGTFWQLAVNPKLKIQSFSLGMLIFRQKNFQFCILFLKTRQPLLPYDKCLT